MNYKLKALPVFIYLVLTFILFTTNLRNTNADIFHLLGITLTLAAFVFWILARFQLGEAFSVIPKAKHLVTKGIYSKVRHPVYVFSSLALLGITIFFRNQYLFYLLLVFIATQITRAVKEERILLKRFGSKYSKYKERTWL